MNNNFSSERVEARKRQNIFKELREKKHLNLKSVTNKKIPLTKEVKTKTHVQIKTENSFLADFAQKHVKGNFFMIKRNDNRWELNQREKVRELESRSV